MSVACRSPLFDRGLLYIVAGVANLDVVWPTSAAEADGVPGGIKVPSYV
jgi:hypothetical protein